MSIFRTLHRSLLALFVIVVVGIIALAHYSISKTVAEQSRAQQQSISPALSLIVDELMQPLHVAQTLSKARELQSLMGAQSIDEEAVATSLQRLHKEFGMYFFIASEKSRRQYDSDGEIIELLPEQVEWYFQFKRDPREAIADIGKWEDPHFYIDIKIYSDDGEFLGFFGTGQNLDHFLTLFAQYKQRYGYDFVFVDENQVVTLSSDPALVAAHAKYVNLQELDWFQQLDERSKQLSSLNNLLINFDGQDYLIAEVSIAPFDWTMYLLSPLQARQTAISNAFLLSVLTLLLVIFALFFVIYHLLFYFKRDAQEGFASDPLLRLANRNKLQVKFADYQYQKRPVAVIMIDMDNFKTVNDTHGYKAGDQVLRQVIRMLMLEIRDEDSIGRWGGERFILMLPDYTPQAAETFAEKLRSRLASMTLNTGSTPIQVTASFGVSFTDRECSLTMVSVQAEMALKQAKADGRNKVVLKLLD